MTPTNGESNLSVKRIFPAGNHGLWVEANNRMRRCKSRAWVAESEAWVRKLGRFSTFNFSQADTRDGLWVGREKSGLIHLDPDGTIQTLTTHDGLASDTVPFAFPDRDGNVWTGYLRGELAQIHPQLFSVLGSGQGLSDTLVTTVCEDKTGAIWMGTVGGAVARYQNGQATNFTLEGSVNLQNSTVVSDVRGRIWVGTYLNGLYGFENGRFRQKLDSKQVGGNIRLLFPARDPNAVDPNAVWEVEWQTNLLNAAMNNLRRRLDPQKFQIFDFYVNKEWPVEKVARRFKVSTDLVYQTKSRVTEALRVEVSRLEKEIT